MDNLYFYVERHSIDSNVFFLMEKRSNWSGIDFKECIAQSGFITLNNIKYHRYITFPLLSLLQKFTLV